MAVAVFAPATVGERYTERLTAAGGIAPYTWAASGLPRGWDLDARRGVISGLPFKCPNFFIGENELRVFDTLNVPQRYGAEV